MKNLFFSAACVAVVMMTSCQKEDLINPEKLMAIDFGKQNVGLNSDTKAGELLDSLALPKKWDFAVSAYDYIGNVGRKDTVIQCDRVSYNTTTSKWEADGGPYYWPAGNVDASGNAINTNLKMVAYAPATTLPGSFAYKTTPTISKTGVKGALKVDVSPANQVDFLYSAPKDFSKGNSVGLTFKHGMTNVIFKVKAAASYGSGANKKDIQVVSIKLNNVYSEGSFTTVDTIAWTPSVPKTYDINKTLHASTTYTDAAAATYSGGLTLTTSYQQFGDKHIFIPQTLENVKADIVVIVNKVPYYYKNIALASFDDAISAWSGGKRVTYNITIGLEEIVFDTPTVTAWSDSSSSYSVNQ